MTKIRTLFGAVSVAAVALMALKAEGAETLRMSTAVVTSHWLVKDALAKWANDVARESNNRLKIQILSTPVGNAASQFEMARDGIVDIVYANPGLTPGRFVLLEAGGLPGIADNSLALSIGLQRLIEKSPEMQAEFKEVKLLGVYVTPPYQIYTTSSRPITDPKDFKGLKVRTGGGVLGASVEAIGAVPINQPFSKTYELLANGVTDGTVSSLDSVTSLKLTPILKHVTVIPGGVGAAPVIVVMNKGRFERLRPEDRDAVMRASGENLGRIIGTMFDGKDDAAIKAMRADGVDVRIADADFVARFQAELRPVTQQWLAQAKKERGVDGQPLIDALKAEVAKAR